MKGCILSLVLCFFVAPLVAQKDISWDIRKGKENAQIVERAIGIVHLARSEKAVQSIGARLVSHLTNNPYTFSFHILDQEAPNAFALPGGYVYVSRGLLSLVKNEDELAGVLGHEISHVVQRHSAKQKKKSVLPAILATPGIILGSTIGGSVGEKVAAPLLGAGTLLLSSYSRKQETEADAMGVELAAKAGYQPATLANILHRIELWIQSETGKATPYSLFNDHPMTPERMTAITSESIDLVITPKDPVYPRKEFHGEFDSLLYGPNPSKGIFVKNTFVHPSMKIYWELPADWKYVNEATFVGATKDESQMVLTIAGKDHQIDTLIERFVNGYYAKTRYRPISDKSLSMPGRAGSEMIIASSDGKQMMYTVWFKKDQMTFVILAGGNTSQIEFYRKTVQTFRDLGESDYPLIASHNLFALACQENEDLEHFNSRIANQLSLKLTALINDVPEAYRGKMGEKLKAVLRIPYTP